MIVEYNSKIFQVIFTKLPRIIIHKKKKRLLIDTRCSILMKDRPSDLWSESREICWGESKQYITDKYSKVIGKKFALLKALQLLKLPKNSLEGAGHSEQYTYRVIWSQEDTQFVGLCAEFPSLSWLASTQEKALIGIVKVVTNTIKDMTAHWPLHTHHTKEKYNCIDCSEENTKAFRTALWKKFNETFKVWR